MQALNRVQLVGVLPRVPEMRYTPSGTAVTSFTVLTYRGWKDDSGTEQSSPEYTNIVVWSKLAEICNQLLVSGSRVFIEGRLQTRSWDDQEGVKRYKTEVIADDMVLLGGRSGAGPALSESEITVSPDMCVNRVQVIGNLARDPELRYLPSGTAVTTFVVATNRAWTNSEGVRQESTEFHNVVCWNTIAEQVSKDINKGQKVYIEGRLQNRSWEGEDGVKRFKTEIVASFIVGSTVRDEMRHEDGAVHPVPSPAAKDPTPSADHVHDEPVAPQSEKPVVPAPVVAPPAPAPETPAKDDEIPF